ncbi:MAG: glycoside hydrolase family 130 protein [Planctomycetota bacterium]
MSHVDADGEVVLMVRVAERPRERRPGFVGLPRWHADEGPVVDWVPAGAVEPVDPRVVRLRRDGALRLTFVSHLRVFRSADGRCFEAAGGLYPRTGYELYGVEDARIVRLGEAFYVTYVAVSEHGAATALASTRDFERFERHGVIFCPENKDVVLFPRMIGGRYVALHRPNPRMHFSRPGIWLARSPDMLHWGEHQALYAGGDEWEAGKVGAGAPPISTERGWLEVYHGNAAAVGEGEVGAYAAGLLLLDEEDPSRVRGRAAEPILVPQAEFEQAGFVPGVVFPTGVVRREGRLLLYYGAADTFTGLVELSEAELLARVREVGGDGQ